MHKPAECIKGWWSLVKPGGVLITVVPDEDLYEQGSGPAFLIPRATENCAINPELASKIALHNFGLAGEDRDVLVNYTPTWKGSVSIYGPPTFVHQAADRTEELITVRKASAVLGGIIANSDEEKIMIKMDCEGAEYEILNDLDKAGLLRGITAFMIEWHDRGKESLTETLLLHGFMVWTLRAEAERDLGLIYAVRSR